MKIDFLTNQNFIVNKKDLKTDKDYQMVADLISMIYQCHCFDSDWEVDDIKKIVENQDIYIFKSGMNNYLQLKIKSLKTTLDVDFQIFD